MASGNISSTGATPFAANGNTYYVASYGSLSSKYSSYRVVSNGVRVVNNMAQLNARGRLFVARVPLPKTIPGQNVMGLLTYDDMFKRLSGIASDSGGNIPSNIIELPNACEIPIQSIMGSRCAHLSNSPTSAKAFDWCSTIDNTVNSANYEAPVSTTNSAGTSIASHPNDTLDSTFTDGWSCIVIRGEGFPASTNAVVELRTAVHLEFIPQISTTAGFTPDSLRVAGSGNLDQALKKAKQEVFGTIVDQAGAWAVNRAAELATKYIKGRPLAALTA
jgi:hypothetical protein